MLTITPTYAANFFDLYINGKENAKLTGDCIKMLILILPFLVRDLVAQLTPEVYKLIPYLCNIGLIGFGFIWLIGFG